MFDSDFHFDTAKKCFLSGYEPAKDVEAGIEKLHGQGYSQLQCVRVLVNVLNVSLPDADEQVLFSKVWEGEKEHTIALRHAFGCALDKYSGE